MSGRNALFGVRSQVHYHDSLLVGVMSGTALLVDALPLPVFAVPKVPSLPKGTLMQIMELHCSFSARQLHLPLQLLIDLRWCRIWHEVVGFERAIMRVDATFVVLFRFGRSQARWI